MNNTHSLIEFFHLPGFMKEEDATIIFSGTLFECEDEKNRLSRVNGLTSCSSEYRYEIHGQKEAGIILVESNKAKEKSIREWRNRVFGEPIEA